MTNPGQGDQGPQSWGQQPYPQQPQQFPQEQGFQQGPYPQGQHQYPQQQFPQGQYQYPYGQDPQVQHQYPQGQYQYSQGQYQQHQGQPPTSFAAPPPQNKGRRGLIIGLVAVLVAALIGGGTWFLLSQNDSVASGAATPDEAAMALATSFSDGDVIGMLSTLAPAEAALLTDPVSEATEELKRLEVLRPDADPNAIMGVSVQTKNLKFDSSQAEQINDHLTITKLTSGTITISGDLSQVPLADEFRDAMLAGLEETGQAAQQTETLNIGDMVRATGEPIRIAAVKVDGEWYASLFYTLADYALNDAGQEWPAQPIPAAGADSPNEAVKQLLQAAFDGDLRRAIELLPPDEMAVLHDMGSVLPGIPDSGGVRLTKLETETSEVTGGTRATITALEAEIPGEGTMSVTKDGDCYHVSGGPLSETMCGDQFGEMMASEAVGNEAGQEFLRSLGRGLFQQGLGVVTTEVDGKHYVSPVRTLNELGMTFLRSMQPEDLKAMLEAAN